MPVARTRPGPVAIGEGPGDRLHSAPDELADGQREADRHDAQSRRRVDRRDEQTQRLPRAHRDHQHRRGDQRHAPPGALPVLASRDLLGFDRVRHQARPGGIGRTHAGWRAGAAPRIASTSLCAACQAGTAALRRRRPWRSVAAAASAHRHDHCRRLPRASSPVASRGPTRRDVVVRSICSRRARSATATRRRRRAPLTSAAYCVTVRPCAASAAS